MVNAIRYIASTGCQWRQLPRDFPPFATAPRYVYGWRDGGLLRAMNHVLAMATREREDREPGPSAGVTDTPGLMAGAVVRIVDVQDRDGAPWVLRSIRHTWPWLRHVFADGGYAGPKLHEAMEGHGDWRIEIIKRSDAASGFEVLPRRWVIARTFAWLGRSPRLAKGWEASTASSEAWLLIAHIRMLVRCLARFHAPPVGFRVGLLGRGRINGSPS